MYLSKKQATDIWDALALITGDIYETLSKEDREKVVKAQVILIEDYRKRKKQNEITAKLIADKRKTNKNYARSRKEKNHEDLGNESSKETQHL